MTQKEEKVEDVIFFLLHFPCTAFSTGCHFWTSCANILALRSATSPLMPSQTNTRNGQSPSLKTHGGRACQLAAAETLEVQPVS